MIRHQIKTIEQAAELYQELVSRKNGLPYIAGATTPSLHGDLLYEGLIKDMEDVPIDKLYMTHKSTGVPIQSAKAPILLSRETIQSQPITSAEDLIQRANLREPISDAIFEELDPSKATLTKNFAGVNFDTYIRSLAKAYKLSPEQVKTMMNIAKTNQQIDFISGIK